MPDYLAIHDFAKRYRDIYKNHNTTESDVSDNFSEQCFELGFEMDCGKSFIDLFQSAPFYNPDALEEVIDDIVDTMLLGCAIFSRWRYVTHWEVFSSLLDERNRKWFLTAFDRLAVIALKSYKKQFRFRGELRKLQLISNNIGFGPIPLPSDIEVEQRLTIISGGRVWLSRYRYGAMGDRDKYELMDKLHLKIDTISIIQEVEQFFRKGYDIYSATDVGAWELRLTNTDGDIFKTHGALTSGHHALDALSDHIRKESGYRDLFVFNGGIS
ncbi:MAG: hypothetical protein IJT82_01790 [Schwartzia sp.]|nr:hypothetical protein [Schwartzia sp. (in: firmicutes)]